ncbi:MAG: exodeoxyribonuclease VII large subunit [Pseudomonadota bacterium]
MDLLDDPTPGMNTPEYSVSELSGAIKRTIEGEFGRIRVRGEVGRVVRARSGHLYFDLKDDRNTLSCTTWKGQVTGLGVMPEEGMEVVATGRMSAFGPQSKYNMNVDELAVAGQGALMAMLEKRKKALEAEGLFAAERKKPLPYLPEVIGVVTSPTGAVIRDILHRLRDRFPRKVLIWPVAVQGQNCAPEVTAGITGFNALTPGGALPRPDLIIVARGGGSIEDLWGFNEESVARAAAASEIPLISAVGHETDTTLIDFVSDRRAPTPTAAAELAVPVRRDLLAWVEEQGARLIRGEGAILDGRGQRLRDLSRALPRAEALMAAPRQRLDLAEARLKPALASAVQSRRVRLAQAALGPGLLTRGLAEEGRRLSSWAARLGPALLRASTTKRERLDARGRLSPGLLEERLTQKRQELTRLATRLGDVSATRQAKLRDRLTALDRLRETLSYKATLERGYAVVRSGGAVVTRKAQVKPAEPIEIEFADGRLATGSSGAHVATPAKKPKAAPRGAQGSLFDAGD